MKNNKTISVIPAYNEEKTIEKIVSLLTQIFFIDEIIVVNDDSSDRTADILKEFHAFPNIKIINHAKNRGKGYSLYSGIKYATGEILVFLDADLINLNKFHIIKLINPLIYNEADMVLGYPPKEKDFLNKINPFRSLTGERALYRKDIMPVLELIKDSGYGVETIINEKFKDKKVKRINLDGLIHPIKTQKVDKKMSCARQFSKEARDILSARHRLIKIGLVQRKRIKNIGNMPGV